ncbi:hypothetical protein OIV83_005511 [Microbotryomycetes sp. JL201]|nr:hypothetical protein OIV83_005511 [Microbotryomycetes sp. JL201]
MSDQVATDAGDPSDMNSAAEQASNGVGDDDQQRATVSDDVSGITLTLRVTSPPVPHYPSAQRLVVHGAAAHSSVDRLTMTTTTVGDVKRTMHAQWPGKPLPEHTIVIKGGRVCREPELVRDTRADQELQDKHATLHVLFRPGAWTEPFPDPLPATDTRKSQPTPDAAVERDRFPSTPSLSSRPYHPAYTAEAPVAQPPPQAEPAPPYATYLAYLSQLIPLQRSLLFINLQKAQHHYANEVQFRHAQLGWGLPPQQTDATEAATQKTGQDERIEVDAIKQLLIECKLWLLVEEQEKSAEQDVDRWTTAAAQGPSEFQIVQVGGLPYLLHTPRHANETLPVPDLGLYRSLKRGQAIHRVLTNMIDLLTTYQPTAPSLAYGQALLSQTNTAAATAAGQFMPAAGVPPHVAAAALAAANRRRATLSIVINLEAILSIVVPMLLLALKVGFLLWIFGRHASYAKRIVMGVMAALWILYETMNMYRRRAHLGRERERLERAQRRGNVAVAAAAGGPPAAHVGPGLAHNDIAQPPQPDRAGRYAHQGDAPADIETDGNADVGLRRRPEGQNEPVPDRAAAVHLPHRPARAGRRRRGPLSRFSPRYWIARIATIGLVEEAHELGLAPRTLAGRTVAPPIPPPGPRDRIGRARFARRKAIRTALIAVVLFFGTLVPEVERKRKRALEKRDRLLAERRVQRERVQEQQDQSVAAAERSASEQSPVNAASVDPDGSAPNAADEDDQDEGMNARSPSELSSPGLSYHVDRDPMIRAAEARAAAARNRGKFGESANTVAAARAQGSASASTSSQLPPPPAGRAVISDAELFANDDDDAHESTPDTLIASQRAEDHNETSNDERGTADELETDDDDEEQGDRQDRDGQDDQVDQVSLLQLLTLSEYLDHSFSKGENPNLNPPLAAHCNAEIHYEMSLEDEVWTMNEAHRDARKRETPRGLLSLAPRGGDGHSSPALLFTDQAPTSYVYHDGLKNVVSS